MNVTHKIYVDLTRRGYTPVIDVVQDEKYTRTVEIGLREGFNLWCPPEDAAVLVRYQKPDGTCGAYDTLPDGTRAYSISGNNVCVTLAPQVLTSEGVVELCITLILANQELTICQGRLNVSGVIPQPEESEDYFSVTGFIPQPETAEVGQYLEVAEVDEKGTIRAVRAVAALSGPLDADTLGGKLPGDFLQHNAIVAELGERVQVSAETKLNLVQRSKVGELFEMYDGGVRCLSDGYVMVSATAMSDGTRGASTYLGIQINKNDIYACSVYTSIPLNYGMISLTPFFLPVSAGDCFTMVLNENMGNVRNGERTRMTLMYV